MPTHPRYFSGQSVTGSVSASDCLTFAAFVEKLNICPQLPLTRKAFMALPKAERQKVKHVPYFTAATFTQSPSARSAEHAGPCNLIFLDLDETPDGKCPAAPFVRNPQLLLDALDGLNFAAHTTASSTPEKPRMRVIVDADEIPVADYPRAVRTIAAMLGLTVLTKESTIATQPMFLPTQFKGDTEENHPLLVNRSDARQFKREGIFDETPDFYQPKPHGKNGSSVDDLEFLRAPVPEITLAIAKEALSNLDPDCSYEDWFNVAAALRHQFSPHEADEAYELFDEWSSEGSKYGGESETKAKWESLKPTPHGRQPITIHTLLKMAVASGWDDGKVKDRGYNAFMRWLEEVESPTVLMEEGIKRLLAIPQVSSAQEGMLLDAIRVKAKERFQHRVTLSDLRKDFARLKVKPPETKKKETPNWAKGLCFVTATQEFYRPFTGEKYKAQAFNMKYARHLLPTPNSLIAAGIPVNEATLSKPIVEPADYVLNYLKIPCFTDYAYVPSEPNEMVFHHEKKTYVNTYAPTFPETDAENAKRAGALFEGHLGNLVAEGELRRILTDFMAYQVQFPGQKIRWAALIQGAEGAGKTYLAEVMKAVLGPRHVKLADGTTIASGWNDWTFGFQLVVIEEVRVQGTNRFDIMNRLKPWITNDGIAVNEKFRSSRDAINITNYILFSNFHDCLALTSNDRRYFVIKSPLQTEAQVLALGKQYFCELFDFLRDHPGAMRSWLLDWEISADFNPNGRAPKTKYVQEMVEGSASELATAIKQLLLDGDHPLIQYDIVSATALTVALTMEHGLGNVSSQHVGHVLREEGFVSAGRVMVGSERHSLWSRRDVQGAAAEAERRVKGDLKNLHMELLF